jgi:CheY-like chemotaxis protein
VSSRLSNRDHPTVQLFAQPHSDESGGVGARAPRILVVDDDARFAEALATLLETAGYEVAGLAADGAEAIRKVEQLQPDLVTMDLDMPLLDGFDAAQLLLTWYPSLAIVFVAGTPAAERGRDMSTIGSPLVRKRDVFDQLVPAIATVLGP